MIRTTTFCTYEQIGPFSFLFVKTRPKLGRRFIRFAYVSSSRILGVLRPNIRPVGNIGHPKIQIYSSDVSYFPIVVLILSWELQRWGLYRIEKVCSIMCFFWQKAFFKGHLASGIIWKAMQGLFRDHQKIFPFLSSHLPAQCKTYFQKVKKRIKS
jgi:hypothetical protein